MIERKAVVFQVAKRGNEGTGGMSIGRYQAHLDSLFSKGWTIEHVYPTALSPKSWSEFINTTVFVRELEVEK
jgi:hypothetical protein